MTFQEILDKLQEANQTEKHSCQCLSRQAPRLPEKSRVPEGPGQPWVGPALPWEPRWTGGATLAHGARTSSRLRLPLRFALRDSATGGRSPHRCRRGGGGCAAKAHVLCHPRTWPGVLGRMGCKLRDPPRTGPAYSRPHQVTSGCGLAAPSCPQGGDPQAPQPCTSPFMKAGKLDLQGRWSGSHSSWRPQASSEDSPFPFQGRLRSCVCGGGGVWHFLPRAAGGRSPGGRGHTCSAHSVGKGARSPAWLPRRLVQGPAFAPAAGVTQVPRVWAADF